MREILQSEFFIMHREQIIKGGVIILIVLAALIVFLFRTGSGDQIELTEETGVLVAEDTEQAEPPEEQEEIVVVDVAGAVTAPSVVYLDRGARVEDAIKAAGGLSKNADISQINRAAVLSDGQKIYIPAEGEALQNVTESVTADSVQAQPEKQTLVNINTATTEELQTIKGVGPSTAAKIIEYRSLYGAFKTIEDIKNVSGIGDKTFESIKDQITV